MADMFVKSKVMHGCVTLFVQDGCPCCRNAWEMLKRCVQPGHLQQISISGREDVQDYLQRSTGQRSAPYIFIGKHNVIGLSDLHNMGMQLPTTLWCMGVPVW